MGTPLLGWVMWTIFRRLGSDTNPIPGYGNTVPIAVDGTV